MDAVHVHLLLAHVPVVGAFGVVFLLLLALLRRSSEFARAALYVAVIIAFAAGAVFLTGEAAEDTVERIPGVLESAIEVHEDVAGVALWSTVVFGALAAGMLVGFRRREIPRSVMGAVLVVSLALGGILGYTANLGGQIRHPELGSLQSPASMSVDPRERER
jgi:uncharacterized membrane protein